MTARRFTILLAALLIGCASPRREHPATRPSVAPTTQPTATLDIDSSLTKPMYRELLAIDLPTIAQVVAARNLDIQQAKHRVEAQRGRYEASVGALFPVVAPAITFQDVQGVNQNAGGDLVNANFSNIIPAVTLQWMLNPGKVVYDIVASKKRLLASQQLERSTQLDALRLATIQYYDLIFAQAKIAAARQAVQQADESLRLTTLRIRAGTGLAADELRSRAFLAGRQQDLLLAVNAFYQSSVALNVTLHLDSTVTLVPAPVQIDQTTLVDHDLTIDQLMAMAVEHRPDLAAARTLLAAAKADKSSVAWSAFGPQLQAAYSYGKINTRLTGDSTGYQEQQKTSAAAGFSFGASSFGQMKTASANFRSLATDVERQLDQVRAQVVSAQQTSLTAAQLIPIARQQVTSATESLRLTQANLKSGTMLLLDVLQAQNELDTARLRYADAVVRYNQSEVNLIAALGLLETQTVIPTTRRIP